MLVLPTDAQIATNDPFFSCKNFPTFMQHAICPMFVKQGHTNLKTNSNRLWWWILFRCLLGRIWVKDRLTSNAPRGWSSEVKKQCPSCPRLNVLFSRNKDVVEIIIYGYSATIQSASSRGILQC